MKSINQKEGFILLELLLAMGILSLAIISTLNLLIKGTQGPWLTLEKTRAIFISQENLIAAKSLFPELNPGIYKAGIDQNGNWSLFPNQDLVGLFLFDGNFEDLSNYKNKVLVKNINFTLDRKSQSMTAGRFNGKNSYLQTKDSISLKRTGPLTISAWIKKIGSQEGAIAGRYNSLSGQGAWLLFQSGSNFIFKILGPEGEDSLSIPVSDLPWENLVGVYDPGGPLLHLYLNGELKASKKTNINSLNLAENIEFFIGSDASLSKFFEGAIDEVRVYNRSLTSKEVIALYGSYSAKEERYLKVEETKEKPIGLWNFQEGEGCILTDESGKGNYGILKPNCTSTAPIWDEGFQNGKSLFFDGNSFIKIGDSPSLRISNEISISLWLKLPDPLPLASSTILQKRATLPENFSFSLFYDGQNKGYGFGIDRGNPEEIEAIFTKNTALPGKWQHILLTFDGGNRKIYIDDREISDLATTTFANLGGDSSLYLGQSSQGSMRFRGNLESLRIFNKIIEPSDRKALFLRKRIYFLTE